MRSAVPHLAAIFVLGACAWLAQWQVERADEKREIIERWNNRSPSALEALEQPFDLPQPVAGVGILDDDRQLLIDNRIRNRRMGVQVLTPLQLDDGRIFLVNRGWAPWPSRSAELPDPSVSEPVIEFRGVLNNPPGTGMQLGKAEIPHGRDWPVLATYFDHEALVELYGMVLQPAVIQLDPEHADHLTGDPWQVVTFGPDRHIGYAITWTSIALVVAAIWLVLTIRQLQRKHR
ncbi:MAG: SURF1 family protein [Wenzhouxiangellaceae bacterium]